MSMPMRSTTSSPWYGPDGPKNASLSPDHGAVVSEFISYENRNFCPATDRNRPTILRYAALYAETSEVVMTDHGQFVRSSSHPGRMTEFPYPAATSRCATFV